MMSRSNELFMQQREREADCDDIEYFELMSEQQWQEAVDEEEDKLHKKYGHQLVFRMEYGKWLQKNGEA